MTRIRCSIRRAVKIATILGLLAAGGAAAAAQAPDPAPEGSFTVVMLPDTQDYSSGGSPSGQYSGPEVFHAITQWIVDNREAQRITFVTHVGDIVNTATNREEWEIARAALDRLHGVVPYGLCIGNHDMSASSGEKPLFEEFFGADRFKGFDWYGGSADNNANSYHLVSVEGVDLLFMNLECNAPDEVLAWADEVLSTHPNRRAIITTHMWLGPVTEWGDFSYNAIGKGRMQWSKCHRADGRGNSPQAMWDEVVRFHPNVMMVLCGDQRSTQAMRMQTMGEEDNIVHEMLSDIRDGYIRLLRFYPAQNRVDVMTFSPTLGMFCDGTEATMSAPRQPIGIVTDITQHQFTLSVNLNGPVRGR